MSKSARNKQRNQDRRLAAVGQLMMPVAAMVAGGLRELVITSGMQVVHRMLEEDRTELCGPRYRHDAERRACRGGTVRSSVPFGGRKVKVRRPRVAGRDGTEVALPTWQWLQQEDPLSERAYEQMVVGVSTRKYGRSLEPLPEPLPEGSTSRSSVSRRFVETTTRKLEQWLSRPLDELDQVAVFLDALHAGEHMVLCALGVDATGRKHVLGLWEGATENGAACRALLSDLVARGLPTERTLLFVIDGAKALRSAIRDVFGRRALVQRCQVHKARNVASHLPKSKQSSVRRAMNQAYRTESAARAKRLLRNLARSLRPQHPGAAASLEEGLEETLTVKGLGLPRTLERSFSTTNPIENMIERIRQVGRRVKRWRGGTMLLRWVAAGVVEAERGFRRLKGCRSMPVLVASLRRRDARLNQDDDINSNQEVA